MLQQATLDAEKINAAGVEVVILDRHGAGLVFRYYADEINLLPSPKAIN